MKPFDWRFVALVFALLDAIPGVGAQVPFAKESQLMSEKADAPTEITAMCADVSVVPAGVTAEVFRQWRSPRRGDANPQKVDNPLWAWMVGHRQSAWAANKTLDGPSSIDAGPMWCFDRFGQSTTRLDDGSTVFIAGEHEDFYDPDFHIYNDVVVQQTDGSLSIYTYPEEIFPPTDFHSATPLPDGNIVIIGNLGYSEHRVPQQTQVLLLDSHDWHVASVSTQGDSPGWLHRHKAQWQPEQGRILITGGLLDLGERYPLVENIDDWALRPDDWRWERLTRRNWSRYSLRRQDNGPLHLFEIRHARWLWKKSGIMGNDGWIGCLRKALGGEPPPEPLATLFEPPLPHEKITPAVTTQDDEDSDEWRTHRIRTDDIVVRFVENTDDIQIIIEGTLPEATRQAILEHVRGALEKLEGSAIVSQEIPNR
jgi:hypothetical protein